MTRPIAVADVATSTVDRGPRPGQRSAWPLWTGLGALVLVGCVTAIVIGARGDGEPAAVQVRPVETPRTVVSAEPVPERDVATDKVAVPAPTQVMVQPLKPVDNVAMQAAADIPNERQSKRAQAREREAACTTQLIAGKCMPEAFTTGGARWVGIDVSLWMTQSEVTAAQYAACVAAKACDAADVRNSSRSRADALCNYDRRADHPMNCVTHAEATAFCAWQGGALPTREQWRLEATQDASPVPRLYPWGSADPSCDTTVMKDARGAGCGKLGTWAVCEHAGDRTVNGLCDMGGNVREWVTDVPAKVGEAMGAGGRALVGGAFDDDNLKAFEEQAFSGTSALNRDIAIGFRCARTNIDVAP